MRNSKAFPTVLSLGTVTCPPFSVHGMIRQACSLIEAAEEGRKYKERILFVGNTRLSIDAGRAGEFY
jgi:hypothetical protein